MATYKTEELFKQLCEIINDGYEFVEVYELEADDDMPASLAFDGLGEFEGVGYDGVESCEIPDDYNFDSPSRIVQDSDYCGSIVFTYGEIFNLSHAVNNALEYFKECLKDTSYSKETISKIKSSSVDCRNLQAKFAKFFKHIKFS